MNELPNSRLMNIKSITNSIIQSAEVKPKKETKTFDADKDKDPQQNSGGHSQQEEAFTEEDIQKAKEYLESHPGILKNNLKVFLEKKNEALVFVVKDHLGKVVRSLSLYDAVIAARQSHIENVDKRGGLLNKSA